MGARTQAECKGGKADKDWIGNCKSIYTILGASNHSPGVRQKDDYYATEPKAMELLLHEERFAPSVWECACGEGHLAKVLEKHGYHVVSTDLVYRGFGFPEPVDFFRRINYLTGISLQTRRINMRWILSGRRWTVSNREGRWRCF